VNLFDGKPDKKKKRKVKPDLLWDAMIEIWPQLNTAQLKGQCRRWHKAFNDLGVQPYELLAYAKKYQKRCGDYLADAGNLPSAGALINQWHNCKPGMSECLRSLYDEWSEDKPEWLKSMNGTYYVFLYVEGMAGRIPDGLLDIARKQYAGQVEREGDVAILHAAKELDKERTNNELSTS
jgi:hypothetical protein